MAVVDRTSVLEDEPSGATRALAGARDAAAVRGVVRSGREPAPGRIVTALRQNGEPPERKGSNPLCVLGGIDRMNDAAAHALLDVLDPVRNRAFRDHYVGLPLDLSEVTFVATATDPEAIPMPLLERLELVQLEEYGEVEKLRIAAEHLLPRQLGRHGLAPADLSLSGEALRSLVRGYTRETGVWDLDRRIGALCRRAARRIAEGCRPPARSGPRPWPSGTESHRTASTTSPTAPGARASPSAWPRPSPGGEVLFVEARDRPRPAARDRGARPAGHRVGARGADLGARQRGPPRGRRRRV